MSSPAVPPRPVPGAGARRGRPAEPAVAAALRSGRFEVALRTAISARGLSLDRLRRHLAERGLTVGITTLSYWQRGLRRPERPESLRAVTVLEQILGLPDRSLTVLLGPRRPRGNACRPAPEYRDIVDAPAQLDALLAELASPAAGALRVVSQFDSVVLGARRQIAAVETVQVVAAHHDGVDRALLICTFEPDCAARQMEITAGHSCRVGRVRHAERTGVALAELLFDRMLHRGETHQLSYRVRPNSDAEAHEHFTAFRLRAGHYVLRVQFDAGALPVRAHRFTAHGSTGPESGRAELTLDSHHSVHLAAEGPGPGVVGIRWEWQ